MAVSPRCVPNGYGGDAAPNAATSLAIKYFLSATAEPERGRVVSPMVAWTMGSAVRKAVPVDSNVTSREIVDWLIFAGWSAESWGASSDAANAAGAVLEQIQISASATRSPFRNVRLPSNDCSTVSS